MLAIAVHAQEQKSPAEKTPYFDEPTFIVAGVTDNSNRGGHGSDAVLRSTEVLARATAGLSSASTETTSEKSLRERIAREADNAGLHHSLGDLEEKLGNSVEALREYQRAVELDASEANTFDLGDELLTHRAVEQAVDVFTRGARLFPRSSRMLLALAVGWYSQGSYDRARQQFLPRAICIPGTPSLICFSAKCKREK